ncbi:hypothetical protein HDV02_003758 [Globomyces sp. JEL0801]|nr:hypothetical protein HDV02_003758 [Globomyces sp. JEL0801]
MYPSPESENQIEQQLKTILNSFQNENDQIQLSESWIKVNECLKELTLLRNKDENIEQTSQGVHMQTNADHLLDGHVSSGVFTVFIAITKFQHHLQDLKQTGLFTEKIINNNIKEFDHLKKNITSLKCISDGECYRQGLQMLNLKMTYCESLIKSLETELESISDALLPIQNRLVEIKDELSSLLARNNPHAFSLVEVQVLQEEVREIDSARIDGKYMTKDGAVVPGQAAVIEILESCFDDIHELLASRDPLSTENPLRNVYEDLLRIKGKLESFAVYSRWSLKGDDLIPFQIRLGQIDNMRDDGIFKASDGSIPEGQAVLHFLLHKCYRLIYKLQNSCEPVAEELMPIYNQILTLQRCLLQLHKWNIELTFTELIPYQMKINYIDSLKQDGKFLDDEGGVPEGQAILFSLLEECHELIRDLQLKCQE